MYENKQTNRYAYKGVYNCINNNQSMHSSQFISTDNQYVQCNKCIPYSHQMYCCRYNQSYHLSCFLESDIYDIWNSVPYAGMNTLPVPETPEAGCWPMCFLKRNSDREFLDPFGNVLKLNIKDPNIYLDVEQEFNYISGIQCDLSYEQIQIAKYWGDGPAPKQFMPIADILIDTYSVPVCNASRILYILNGAINDAFVVTWYLKYVWNIVRPCQYNKCFKTILCTPMHPTYPSGHSTSAGCMAEILAYFFPTEREKLFMLARQCSNSRIYAGVHFKSDCDEGMNLGIQIAKSILEYTSMQTDCLGRIIDIPYAEHKNANIIPITLQQYIPFKRINKCESLLLETPEC